MVIYNKKYIWYVFTNCVYLKLTYWLVSFYYPPFVLCLSLHIPPLQKVAVIGSLVLKLL